MTAAIEARQEPRRLDDRPPVRRARVRGIVVLDLLLPEIEPGEIEIVLDIDHAKVKLLVPDAAAIDDGDLRRVGRGRVKDWTGTARPGGRRIELVGEMRNSEVRVPRGGVALLSLLAARTTRRQVRDAHRAGRLDPAA
jgi:hypothetical protein